MNMTTKQLQEIGKPLIKLIWKYIGLCVGQHCKIAGSKYSIVQVYVENKKKPIRKQQRFCLQKLGWSGNEHLELQFYSLANYGIYMLYLSSSKKYNNFT